MIYRLPTLTLCLLILAGPLARREPLVAQEPAAAQQPLNRTEARRLVGDTVDLMEAVAIVTPALARAGAPLIETVRGSIETLDRGQSAEHVGVIYRMLRASRVYVQLADSLPKSPNFTSDARGQLEHLRSNVDRIESYFQGLLDRREAQILGADRDQLSRYAEDNQLLPPPVEGERRVVFLGDSITDFWQLNQYFPGKPYVNRGISGQTTGQMLGRMKADVLDLQPEVMVLLAGTNDLARGVPQSTIRANIEMIVDLARARRITPVLASILPVHDAHADKNPRFLRTTLRPPSDIVELNHFLSQLAATHGIPYLDYHAATVNNQGLLQTALADDGLHPNAEGYKVLAPLAEAAIAQALSARNRPAAKRAKRFGVF